LFLGEGEAEKARRAKKTKKGFFVLLAFFASAFTAPARVEIFL